MMNKLRFEGLLFPSMIFFLAACSGSLRKIPETFRPIESSGLITVPPGYRSMTIQYLGAGGLYLLNDDSGILIDPFFSNPNIFKVGASLLFNTRNLGSRPKMISLGMKDINSNQAKFAGHVKAIFVTHSHYDHLMDVPAVFGKLGNKPMVYLNRSGYNTCYKLIDTNKMIVLEEHMTSQYHGTPSKPIVLKRKKGRVNIYPILADHNPHVKHLKAFDGDVTKPDTNKRLGRKTRGNDWLEGNTFSFVIDYIDEDGVIELRIFIQSSSCNPVAGFPPETIPKHRVDIAFLGVASYKFSPMYPAELLDTMKPKKIVWIHWEDFFRRYSKKKPRTVRSTDVPDFFIKEKVAGRKDDSYVPWPGATFEIRY